MLSLVIFDSAALLLVAEEIFIQTHILKHLWFKQEGWFLRIACWTELVPLLACEEHVFDVALENQ